MDMPKVGDFAPLFNLEDDKGQQVALEDLRGEKNVVLYFYPKAMTPGCTLQACGIRDTKGAFAEKETVVFGISPDTVDRLRNFVEKEKLNFPLLSDVDKVAIKAYGAWGVKKFMGKTYGGVLRISFVIGKDGRIKHVVDKVKTKTHHEDILSLLD